MKNFSIFIRISYRIRGKALRVKIYIIEISLVFIISSILDHRFDIIYATISLIIIIFMYSVIKMIANLLYPILKPDTSSDSLNKVNEFISHGFLL